MNRERKSFGASVVTALAAGTLSLLVLALSGCASAPPPADDQKPVWPPPPLEPRIKYEQSIASVDDLDGKKGASDALVAFLTGEKIPEGRIAQPMGLAISDDCQRLYVADPLQHLVFTFDFKARTLTQNKEVNFPGGVALDAQENLYVVDTVKKSVSVFARDGKFVREFSDASMVRPNGIAIDRVNDRVYVVDTGDSESKEQNVKVFNTAGQRIGAIGGAPGGGFGEFSYPTMATVDDKGNLYVTDTLNARVQKFDAKGNFLTVYGRPGSAWGEFDKPKGVAVDSFGNIYVADSGWSNVQIFNPKGQVLLFFGGRGPLPGMMKNPISLVIDKQNRIYVGDYLNHRIGVYQLVNTKSEDSYVAPPPNPTGAGK